MKLNQVLDEITTIMSNIIKKHKEMLISKSDLSNITYGQFQFIHKINQLEKPTITLLAKEMNLAKPTVTIAVSKLIESGIVEKIKSPDDKRVHYLKLTSKGENLGRAEMNAFDEIISNLKVKLTEDEFNMFEHILRKLLDN